MIIVIPRLPGAYILTLTLKRRNLQEKTVGRHWQTFLRVPFSPLETFSFWLSQYILFFKVKELQQKSYRARYLKKHIYALSKSKHLPGDVTFLCRKCKETVCQAHDVRCIQGSHHVIINSDVRDTKVIFLKKKHTISWQWRTIVVSSNVRQN